MKRMLHVGVLVLALVSAPVPARAEELTCQQGYEEMKAIAWSQYNSCLATGLGSGSYMYAAGCAATYAASVAAANAFLLACELIPRGTGHE